MLELLELEKHLNAEESCSPERLPDNKQRPDYSQISEGFQKTETWPLQVEPSRPDCKLANPYIFNILPDRLTNRGTDQVTALFGLSFSCFTNHKRLNARETLRFEYKHWDHLRPANYEQPNHAVPGYSRYNYEVKTPLGCFKPSDETIDHRSSSRNCTSRHWLLFVIPLSRENLRITSWKEWQKAVGLYNTHRDLIYYDSYASDSLSDDE